MAATRYTDAELALYHGSRAAYLATARKQLLAREAVLAAGPSDADLRPMPGMADVFGARSAADWQAEQMRAIDSIRAAIAANA